PAEQRRYFARLADPLAALDVGGIAKGYIADSLTDSMLANETQSFCISLGGNTVARGRKPNGSPWQVGIQDPADQTAIIGALELIDASLVTSGIYERSFTLDGRLYHHILDPQTGYPVDTDVAGVSVLAKRSIDAEGFSTTLLALGISEGLAYARRRPEIENAIFVDRQGGVFST
ncbi:MAG: FAD:protein FMN transferase, partial [Coriobacteriia bacterium]|nr:FAD:protein FMN transferase [Coriobacteriia bacterium]